MLITHLTQSTSEPQITQITQITQIFSDFPGHQLKLDHPRPHPRYRTRFNLPNRRNRRNRRFKWGMVRKVSNNLPYAYPPKLNRRLRQLYPTFFGVDSSWTNRGAEVGLIGVIGVIGVICGSKVDCVR